MYLELCKDSNIHFISVLKLLLFSRFHTYIAQRNIWKYTINEVISKLGILLTLSLHNIELDYFNMIISILYKFLSKLNKFILAITIHMSYFV